MQNNPDKADSLLQAALQFAIAEQDTMNMIDIYLGLETVKTQKGNYKAAKENLQKVKALLNQKQKTSDLNSLNLKKELQYRIELANKSENLQAFALKNQSQKRQLNIGIVASAFIILALWFFYREKQRKNEAIALQKETEMEKKEVQLRQKNLEIENLTLLHQQVVNALVDKHNNEYAEARLSGEQVIREQMALKLHDGVCGNLTALRWSMEGLAQANPQITPLCEHAKDIYDEVRQLSKDLEHGQMGLIWHESLQRFCERINQNKGSSKLQVIFSASQTDTSIDANLGDELRYIVQEIITNTLKHANAETLYVQIDHLDNEIHIYTEESGGIGFDENAIGDGSGLANIRRRVEKLDGTFTLQSNSNIGTNVIIVIPLKLPMSNPFDLPA